MNTNEQRAFLNRGQIKYRSLCKKIAIDQRNSTICQRGKKNTPKKKKSEGKLYLNLLCEIITV